MPVEITNAEKIRKLPWNIALSAANNIFAQLTYFGPSFVLFLSALGASNSEIGFVLSLLPFFGIVALFIAPQVARFGYKRTFLISFNIRNMVTAGLLLVPTVLARYGEDAAFAYVAAIVMGFALCRAIGETGFIPWAQEFIPNSIRGTHTAINDMVTRITGLLAIALAGFVLGLSDGLEPFMILFAIAVAFEVIAAWSAAHLPGGGPAEGSTTSYRHLLHSIRDKNFSLYLTALGFVIVAGAPLAFLPLFMQNQIGLSDSAVVWLQMGTIIGGFVATYFLGWASDRYGSKPIMLTGLYVKALLPLGWLLMPRNSEWSLPVALIIAVIWGIFEIAWAIGSGRLLYVKVVPYEKKTEYMAVFYAAVGIIGGLSQIASGWLLDATADLSGQFLIFPVDQFTPLFIGSIVLTGVSIILFNRVQADSPVSVGEFAGMFIHGNPVLALESLVRYYRSPDERATVMTTERMGQTRSLFTVDELLEALKDPRFNVRFEAIISIARMGSEPRLVDALCQILDGTEISLSVISAWALGRMGDKRALPTLRNGLHAPYRSLQAHCARSLGTLADTSVAPLLLERLQTETDKGLRIAYASALGNLKAQEALETLFGVLAAMENEGARMELALAIARIIGGEQRFIRLLRQLRQDAGTAASQALIAWKRKLDKSVDTALKERIDECAHQFARGKLDEGAALLSGIITTTSSDTDDSTRLKALTECADRLEALKAARIEYLLLALHTLQAGE
jgi:MFS family permease